MAIYTLYLPGTGNSLGIITILINGLRYPCITSVLQQCHRAPQGLSWDRFGLGPLPRLVHLVGLKFAEFALAKADVAALAPSMKQLTGLQRLTLSSEPLEPDQASTLSSSLSGMVSLEHLMLKGARLEAQHVAMILPGLTALRHRDLRSDDAFSCPAAAIAPALATLTALTHLDMGGDYVWTADDMTAMAPILSPLARLLHLDLANYPDGPGAAPAFNFTASGDALSALGHSLPPSLTFLSLGGNVFGANGIIAMVPDLRRLTALETLLLGGSIDGSNDSVEDRVSCLQALAGCMQRMPALTSLDLGCNCFGDDSTLALAGCLQHASNVQSLVLSHNELGAGGARQLAGSLQRMPKLRSLFLHSNSIGDDGVAGLASSLMGSASLTEINLSENELTVSSLCSLKAALVALSSGGRQHMTALVLFHLSGNSLGGLRSADSAQALAGCLEHMPRLRALNLGHNNLCDNGAKQLAIGIQRMFSLRTLQLNDNGFGDGGATDLVGSLVGLTSLTYIDIEENKFTDVARDILGAALKRQGRTVYV